MFINVNKTHSRILSSMGLMNSIPLCKSTLKHNSKNCIVITIPSERRSPSRDFNDSITVDALLQKNSWGFNKTYAASMCKHNLTFSEDDSVKIYEY